MSTQSPKEMAELAREIAQNIADGIVFIPLRHHLPGRRLGNCRHNQPMQIIVFIFHGSDRYKSAKSITCQ